MNDTIEIVLSWLIIFMVALFAIITGEFIGQVNAVDSFHAQVNPIIEEYGGDSNLSESAFTDDSSQTSSAQEQISGIAQRMLKSHHIAFVVTPDTNESKNNYPQHLDKDSSGNTYADFDTQAPASADNLESYVDNASDKNTSQEHESVSDAESDHRVAPYGNTINYEVHMVLPYSIGGHYHRLFNKTIKYSTASKVGVD